MINFRTDVPSGIFTLINMIRELQYGEMFSVIPEPSDETVEIELSAQEKALAELFDEVSEIDVLTVHNGQPVLAEIDFRENGFRCRKKIKL